MCAVDAHSCKLLPPQVPVEALIEYWTNLPEEHRTALFQLRDEDFAAELDAHLKYQLRICKDCRGNVTRAFRCALLLTSSLTSSLTGAWSVSDFIAHRQFLGVSGNGRVLWQDCTAGATTEPLHFQVMCILLLPADSL